VGLRSTPNVLLNYDTVRAVLSNGGPFGAMVGVGPALIKIANATTTLNTLLQTLITTLDTFATATGAITVTGVTTGSGISGPPANAASFASVVTSLNSLSAQIALLLE
jgi:hypothetical protein